MAKFSFVKGNQLAARRKLAESLSEEVGVESWFGGLPEEPNYPDDIITVLISRLKSTEDQAQSKAVKALAWIALHETDAWNSWSHRSEQIDDVVGSLGIALQSQDNETREAAARVLGALAHVKPERVATALVITDQEEDSSVRISMLDALAATGLTSAIVPATRSALSHDCPEVRLKACAILGSTGRDLKSLLPDLLKRVLGGSDEAVRMAAIRAITKIDATGDVLAHTVRRSSPAQAANLKQTKTKSKSKATPVREQTDQEVVLAMLPQIASDGEHLWNVLHEYWDGPSPPPGYRRMVKNDILAFIFGEGARISNNTLRAWMDDGRLHAIQVEDKIYDVKIADLEALRAARNPGADSV